MEFSNPFENLDHTLKEIKADLAELKADIAKRSDKQDTKYERLTISEISKQYKVSKPTIHRLKNSGSLPYSKVGRLTRFKKEDVELCFSKKLV